MGAKRRPWLYHEEFMDHRLGGAFPTGVLWAGKEVWSFSAEGVTDADASTTVTITGLPVTAVVDRVLPMFPAATLEFAPGVWQPSSALDAVDLQLVLLTSAGTITLNHSVTYQSKPYLLAAKFVLV